MRTPLPVWVKSCSYRSAQVMAGSPRSADIDLARITHFPVGSYHSRIESPIERIGRHVVGIHRARWDGNSWLRNKGRSREPGEVIWPMVTEWMARIGLNPPVPLPE